MMDRMGVGTSKGCIQASRGLIARVVACCLVLLGVVGCVLLLSSRHWMGGVVDSVTLLVTLLMENIA